MTELEIKPGSAPISLWRQIAAGAGPVRLPEKAWADIARSRGLIEQALASGRAIYGVNTGFGKLAQTRIPDADLKLLQRNLVLSHAAGVGEPLGDDVVRLVMALKVSSLARGYSGVRPVVVETLLTLLNKGVLPQIPAQGSVGASGDLAPLAHMSAVLIGEGHARYEGAVMSARAALTKAGIHPLELEAKEGLALLNGTQVSTALALINLFAAEANLEAAFVAGALSTDAVKGSDTPFDARIHDVRGQKGQIAAAATLRALMAGSDIRKSHVECQRVQDPYSIRCQPQVLGPCFDMLNYAADIFAVEANAATDNPLIFENGDVLSGGNFHAEPIAIAANSLAIAIAEIGALSERRIALLINSSLSELPPFLTEHGGVNSGLHDCACDGGGAGLGEQVAGASRLGEFAADLGQPGRFRLHGDLCGAQAWSDERQHAPYPGDRASGRCGRHRIPPPDEDVGGARNRACEAARARAPHGRRPLLRAGHRSGGLPRRGTRL